MGRDGSFTKTVSGIIYGYTSGDTNSNVVKRFDAVQSNSGHAVYISGYPIPSKRRDTYRRADGKLGFNQKRCGWGWEN